MHRIFSRLLLVISAIVVSACSAPTPSRSTSATTGTKDLSVPASTETPIRTLPPETPTPGPTYPSTTYVPSAQPPVPFATSTLPATYPVVSPVRVQMKYKSFLVKTKYTRVSDTLVHKSRLFFTGRLHPSALHTLPNAIFERDLNSGKTKLLTTSVHGDMGVISCPDASDHWIAWLTYLEPVGDLWRVYAKNIDTGEEVVIDKQEDAGVSTTPHGPYLAIWGDKVVWTSLRATKEDKIISVVMVEDLGTRVRKGVIPTDP